MLIGSLKTPVDLHEDGYYMQDLSLQSFCAARGTPCFLYDINHVLNNFRYVKSAFPWPKLRIHYAMKANFNMDILRALAAEGAFLDTISPAEFFVGRAAGFPLERILFTSNNITNEEMRLMHPEGARFNIDSLSGLRRLGEMFPGSEVSVRFNPDVVAGEHENVKTGGVSSKFGVLLTDADTVCDLAKKYNLKIVGVHEHTGSGVGDLDKAFQSMQNLLAISTRERFPDLDFVDFGGGLKVPYKLEEKRVDYVAFGRKVVDLFADYCKSYGRELFLHFEPGKYLVAEAGIFFLQVNTIKDNQGYLIAGTDSGFPHLIRPVLYNAYHHIVNISNPFGEVKTYDICGNTAESDVFARRRELPEVREGDFLAFLNAGAYCFSMASTYNLRALPAEYILRDNKLGMSRAKLTPRALAAEIEAHYPGAQPLD